MCGFKDAMSNLIPVEWLDPYGESRFAKGMPYSVDITIVETDDGIRATSVKNPPTSGPSRMMDAIKQVLGVDFSEIGPQNGSQRSVDLGKRNGTDMEKNDRQDKESDTSSKMKTSSPSGSEKQGSQPWPDGKPPEEPDAKATEKDAKEKAPKF